MKIDKVVFTSSEEYSDFWNIISKIYKNYLNIEPVCLLFGKKANTNVNEKFGEVKEVEPVPGLHKLLQLTWYKFWYTTLEPETTWMIGDIDQIPLQKYWFIDNIKDMPDDCYLHLNSTAIAQNINKPLNTWINHGGMLTGGIDLPAHYHVAKGKTFKTALEIDDIFQNDIKKIVDANKYGYGINVWGGTPADEKYYWCAEENYSSELLHNSYKNKKVKLALYHYNNTTHKLDRSRVSNNRYLYDLDLLKSNQYVDIHCIRPYKDQEEHLLEILKIANIL